VNEMGGMDDCECWRSLHAKSEFGSLVTSGLAVDGKA
jgi:hypothetical protein